MKVFITYRREDSAGYTGRLYDSLRVRFGDDNVGEFRTSSVAGEWQAEVTYEWGAKYSETLSLNVERRDVSGTPSFLGVARGSTIEGDRISFETRSQEAIGDFSQPRNVVHRYRGRINGDTIAFTMQPEGGSSQVPATFTARRR